MPERYIHEKISKIILGEKYSKVHKAMDYPVKYLGKRHRILFHDILSASLIGFSIYGYNGALAGILHLIADKNFNTKFRKNLLKLSLKFLGYIFSK
jgi:hypothetical protein